MNPVKEAYRTVDSAGKTELLRFLAYYFNKDGIRNIVAYHVLETLNENDPDDQRVARSLTEFLSK